MDIMPAELLWASDLRIGGSSPKDSSMAWSSVAVSLPSWGFMAGTIPKSRRRMWPGYSEMLGLTPTRRKEKDDASPATNPNVET